MSLQKGSASKKIRDAIDADAAPSSTSISDASTVGKAVLTAADAAAVRTAIGAPAATGVAPLVSVPASASAAGTAGSIAYDATHFYVCVAASTWVRCTTATW